MNQAKKVYLIGIGGIGVSALARYYKSEGWEVFWSDNTRSELISKLQSEWCDIIIWSDQFRMSAEIDLVIYSEAVPVTQGELVRALELKIKTRKYNDALWEVVNSHKLIAVTGTHGKSTTTSMISQILKNSWEDFKAIIWTLLKEFDGKNFYSSKHSSLLNPLPLQEKVATTNSYFAIEACEYKEHFLAYKPSLAVIINIEYDHADYFKTPRDYIRAYEKFIENIIPGWFCVINGEDENCKNLIWKRKDIHYIVIKNESFSTIFPGDIHESNIEHYPDIVMNVPGEHILFDAKIAYVVSHMVWITEISALETLEEYSWVWRRMEKIGLTQSWNILMSDYGHHPTEVATTLAALKSWYPDKKLFVVFQPHQYSRTIELLEGFKICFLDADTLIIPDIYESRDSEENKAKMNSEIFVEALQHQNKMNGEWLENSLALIERYDSENPDSSIILLLGAGNIDNLRYKIKTS
jgi:UDP-N-acetylmuramate--alanine ligase